MFIQAEPAVAGIFGRMALRVERTDVSATAPAAPVGAQSLWKRTLSFIGWGILTLIFPVLPGLLLLGVAGVVAVLVLGLVFVFGSYALGVLMGKPEAFGWRDAAEPESERVFESPALTVELVAFPNDGAGEDDPLAAEWEAAVPEDNEVWLAAIRTYPEREGLPGPYATGFQKPVAGGKLIQVVGWAGAEAKKRATSWLVLLDSASGAWSILTEVGLFSLYEVPGQPLQIHGYDRARYDRAGREQLQLQLVEEVG
ncbi:hypothetical protein [Hymenobacter sp. B81]|uniref:hypothetical protein n=1 Tax=Hymenobacter sp. B81 TaxID=3344878 RepID=UPI0037DDB41A